MKDFKPSWCKGDRLSNQYSLLLHPDKNDECVEASERLYKEGQNRCKTEYANPSFKYEVSTTPVYSSYNPDDPYGYKAKADANFNSKFEKDMKDSRRRQAEEELNNKEDLTFDDVLGALGSIAAGVGWVATGIGYGLFYTGALTLDGIGYGLSFLGNGVYDLANEFHESVATDFIS